MPGGDIACFFEYVNYGNYIGWLEKRLAGLSVNDPKDGVWFLERFLEKYYYIFSRCYYMVSFEIVMGSTLYE